MITNNTGTDYVYDIEVYQNYYGVGFLNVQTNETVTYSSYLGNINDLKGWWDYCRANNIRIFGFNNFSYDDHILWALLSGERDFLEIYGLSQSRINNKQKFVVSPLSTTIDLRAILGESLIGGLKELGVKLDHPKLQELPFAFDKALTDGEIVEVEKYNINDLEITAKLVRLAYPDIEARRVLSKKYGVDVHSKKDSRIAETILRKQLFAGERVSYPKKLTWSVYGREIIHPDIQFTSDAFVEALDVMRDWRLLKTMIIVDNEGKRWSTERPNALEVRHCDIVFSLGVGGLHTEDAAGVFRSNEEYDIIDIDVQSFYPSIVRSMKLAPSHLDEDMFLKCFTEIIDERLRAKAAGDKELSYGLKIAINSVYGKFSNQYSFLCDPKIAWQVTINGQLILLMLVELLSELDDVKVLSANTDGVTVYAARNMRENIEMCVQGIEQIFSLKFEYNSYLVYARRDINNYVAIDVAGNIKAKGAYGYDKNNMMKKACERIIVDACQQYFIDGVDVETTIRACDDIREFLNYFKCSSGYHIEYNGQNIGSLARWYVSKDGYPINKTKDGKATVISGNLPVVVLNDLPQVFPRNIDYDYYIEAAKTLIRDIENPKAVSFKSNVALADLNKEQRDILKNNNNDETSCIVRMAHVDIGKHIERYAACGREQYVTMKSIASRIWVEGNGILTRGDLYALVLQVDEGTDYFKKNDAKKRDLLNIVDWCCREVVPFKREKTIADHAKVALHGVRDCTPNAKPKLLSHYSPSNSTLVTKNVLSKYLASGDIAKLARAVAFNAAKNSFDLTEDYLVLVLRECESLRNVGNQGDDFFEKDIEKSDIAVVKEEIRKRKVNVSGNLFPKRYGLDINRDINIDRRI